jgi:hypothetical protein
MMGTMGRLRLTLQICRVLIFRWLCRRIWLEPLAGAALLVKKIRFSRPLPALALLAAWTALLLTR